jgi:hypothetical protein
MIFFAKDTANLLSRMKHEAPLNWVVRLELQPGHWGGYAADAVFRSAEAHLNPFCWSIRKTLSQAQRWIKSLASVSPEPTESPDSTRTCGGFFAVRKRLLWRRTLLFLILSGSPFFAVAKARLCRLHREGRGA